MYRWIVFLIFLFVTGCSSLCPERVFEESTSAFACGDVERGVKYFSKSLLKERPIGQLEQYYSVPENCKRTAAWLKNYSFQVIKKGSGFALGKVTWSTGKSEPVYFVREDGEWKLDLPPIKKKGLSPKKPEE